MFKSTVILQAEQYCFMTVCSLLLQDKGLYDFALYRTTKQGFPISDM